MDDIDVLLPRHAFDLINARLGEGRVVAVNGARQAGKTALLRMVHRHSGGTLSTFDDASTVEAARRDPFGFVTGFPYPHLIDEIQRGGGPVLLAIKRQVDLDPAPGQYVLTGSTRFLTEPRLSESLAGRVRMIDLWPLSQGEIHRGLESFIQDCFHQPGQILARYRHARALSRRETYDALVIGGFPESVLATSESARRGFFQSYFRTVTQRDVGQLAKLRLSSDLPRLARLLLGRSGTELNAASMAGELRLNEETVRRHLALLEAVYLIHLLPAWSRNLSSRQRRRPKVHAVDTGLASALLNQTAERLARPGAPLAGELLETFVVNEVLKQLSWSGEAIEAYHWREDQGREVDLVLERGDGAVVAIEVKAGVDVRAEDLRGLSLLRDRLGHDLLLGVLFHCGDRVVPLGDRLIGVPISALWFEAQTKIPQGSSTSGPGSLSGGRGPTRP